MTNTVVESDYVGRRRRDPKCEVGLDGCKGTGMEIINPYLLELDGSEEIIVACSPCEDKLSQEI